MPGAPLLAAGLVALALALAGLSLALALTLALLALARLPRLALTLLAARARVKSWFLPCLLNGSCGPLLPCCFARRIASRRSSICDDIFFCVACLR